jgi:hypothetical protein
VDRSSPTKKEVFDQLKKMLAVNIKLDIARTIRHHPHLQGERSLNAYQELANDNSVDQIIRELAREEVEAAIARGDLPQAAIIHLAGYRQNPIAEG